MYFRKYRLRKTWLDKCLKRRVSEDPQRENMENGSKHFSNLNGSNFTISIKNLKVGALEKVSFANTKNPKAVC